MANAHPTELEDEEGALPGSSAIGFERVSAYDVPATVLEQVLDGDISWSSFRRTFLDPSSLTPAERTGFRDRIANSIGGGAVAKGLVDLATNPLVWALFAFAPAGPKAVKMGQRLFGGTPSVQAGYVKWVGKNRGFLSMLMGRMGLLGTAQTLSHTAVPEILSTTASRLRTKVYEWEGLTAPALGAWLRTVEGKFGLKPGTLNSMNPDLAPNKAASIEGETVHLKEYLREATRVLSARGHGMDELVARPAGKVEPVWLVRASRQLGNGGESPQWVDDFYAVPESLAKKINERVAIRHAGDVTAPGGLPTTGTPIRDAIQKAYKPLTFELPDGSVAYAKGATPLRSGDVPRGTLRESPEGRRDRFVLELVKGPQPMEGGGARPPGPPTFVWSPKERDVVPMLSRDLVDEFIDKNGLAGVVEARRNQFERMAVDMWLDEAAWAKGEVKVDREKAVGLYRTLSKSKTTGRQGPADEAEMAALGHVEGLFGGEVREALRTGQLQKDEWLGLVDRMVGSQFGEGGKLLRKYEPRNTVNTLGVNGKNIPEEEALTLQRRGRWYGGGEIRTRRTAEPAYDFNDLEAMRKFSREGSPERLALEQEILRGRQTWEASIKKGEAVAVLGLDANRASFQHIRRSAKDYVLGVDRITEEEMTALRDKPLRQADVGETPLRLLDPAMGRDDPLSMEEWLKGDHDPKRLPEGGVRRMDLVEHFISSKQPAVGSENAEFVREVMMPRILGEAPVRNLVLWDGIRRTRQVAKAMADSRVAKSIEESGSFGKKVIGSLREWGSRDTRLMEGTELAGNVSTWLYASHLGLNMGTVTMNLMQPWLLAGTLTGYGNLAKAYPRAFKDLGKYLEERVKLGRGASKAELRALLGKHMPLTNVDGDDLVGITDDLLESLDGVAFSRSAKGNEGGAAWWAATTLPLLPFQASEWLNRLVTAYSVEEMYGGLGKGIRWDRTANTWRGVDQATRFRLKDDIKGMVQRTQFGGDILHQPQVFLTHLDNPVLRMFLSFPLRTLTGYMETSQQVLNRGAMGTVADVMRTLGMSAVIYEAGKQALGVDLSPGLGASSLTQVFGGSNMLRDRQLAAPLPPAFDIAYGLARGGLMGDTTALRDSVARLIPAGVAIQRALGAAPDLGALGLPQKEFADWGNPGPDGNIPVFDKGTGALTRYANPAELVFHGLGADLGRWKDAQELTAYLKSNRERIVDYRRRYIQALLGGNTSQAEGIKAEYQKAIGLPLTVSRSQWQMAIRLRQVPMAERVFEQLPNDVRRMYAKPLADRGGLLGQSQLGPEELGRRLSQPVATRFEDRQDVPQAGAFPGTFQQPTQ